MKIRMDKIVHATALQEGYVQGDYPRIGMSSPRKRSLLRLIFDWPLPSAMIMRTLQFNTQCKGRIPTGQAGWFAELATEATNQSPKAKPVTRPH